MKTLLPKVLNQMEEDQRIQKFLQEWPLIVGEKYAASTQAISLRKKVLTIKVRNPVVLSILSSQEKKILLKKFHERFPGEELNDIVFRIG